MSPSLETFVSRRTSCRLCDGHDLTLVMPIRATPIADNFVRADQLDREQPSIPLDLYQCGRCGHVQNLDIVNPEWLFRDYLFATSGSAALVEHFRKYADSVVAAFAPPEHSLVVEIGSNDGTLLRFFQQKGLRTIGIDPAREIAQQATSAGLQTIPDFFTSRLAETIRREHGAAKLLVANNVYAHADDLGDITDGIATLLDTDGVFVFEVSYLLDIVDKYLFDTVYHEHLSYHSIEPFTRFFDAHGMRLFDVQRITTKGGSMRGFAQRLGGPQAERPVIQQMIAEERRRGLHQPAIFAEYEKRVFERKAAVLGRVGEAISAGKRVAGFGASTTAITLMYHFELDDKLAYLIDDNPRKHGMFSPGRHLEVKPSSVLYQDRPDMVVILVWQYAEPILSKHGKFAADGGRFLVPLPELRVVGA